MKETHDFGPVFQMTLSSSITHASRVSCHWPPVVILCILNWPDGALFCRFVSGIMKFPVKKSRCGFTVCDSVIVSFAILKSLFFGEINWEVSVSWIESIFRYKLGVFPQCCMTPSTFTTKLLPGCTITGSPATRGCGLIDSFMDVLWRTWKKNRGMQIDICIRISNWFKINSVWRLVMVFWLPCSAGKYLVTSFLILRQPANKYLVSGYEPSDGVFGGSDGETKQMVSTEWLRIAHACCVLQIPNGKQLIN